MPGIALPATTGLWCVLGYLGLGGLAVAVGGRRIATPLIYGGALAALRATSGIIVASAHESHAYLEGACLYFTFAGRGADPADDAWAEAFYRDCWQAVLRTTSANGGSISHHHGIGLVRGPYLAEALGTGFGVLEALKTALDPRGILNPGKLGLPSPFGASPWPDR